MTRPQRLVLIVGLLIIAATAHTLCCDWSFGDLQRNPILGWNVHLEQPSRPAFVDVTTGRRVQGRPRPDNWETWGIVPEQFMETHRAPAIGWGIVVPLVCILIALILVLGWRRASWQERGCCLQCGHDLRFDYASGCPECGWRRLTPD